MPSAAGAFGSTLEAMMLQREKSAMEATKLEMERQRHQEQMQGDREDRQLRRELLTQQAEDRRLTMQDREQARKDREQKDREGIATARANRYEKTTGGMAPMDYMTTDLQKEAVATGNAVDLVNPPQKLVDDAGAAVGVGTPPMEGVLEQPPAPEDLIRNKIPLFFRGTPAGREKAAKTAQQQALIDQSKTPEERRTLELDAAGLHLPTPPASADTMTDANYNLPGVGDIVGVRNKQGRIFYKGQDVTDQVKPYHAPWQPREGNGPPIDISPGTSHFKVAQDLAYGRMTFQMFQRLIAYNRDSNMKMDLYAKAADLNPGFNPAAFEMGYKLAATPKVRQQLASMDNVLAAVPDLLKISDAAERSGLTKLNEWTNPIKVAIGDRRFTNLAIVRTGFADELSGALGFGSATDMSREMGYDMTNPNLSPANFKAGIEEVVIPFIQRKRDTLLKQMNVYGTPEFQPPPTIPENKDGTTAAPAESAWDRYQKSRRK